MIVFDLLCVAGHRFEGWFGSRDDFEGQKKHKIIQCPTCGSPQVARVPSATRANLGAAEPKKPLAVATAGANPAPKTPEMEGKDAFAIAQMLYSRMLDELLTKSEDVGKEFPKVARRIFYKEDKARPIRGQATEEEHDELVEEGIPVARLPVPPRDRLN
jgi:hypothetical protein